MFYLFITLMSGPRRWKTVCHIQCVHTNNDTFRERKSHESLYSSIYSGQERIRLRSLQKILDTRRLLLIVFLLLLLEFFLSIAQKLQQIHIKVLDDKQSKQVMRPKKSWSFYLSIWILFFSSLLVAEAQSTFTNRIIKLLESNTSKLEVNTEPFLSHGFFEVDN